VIDVDATLTTAHSEKEEAKGNFKGGYGHHPLVRADGAGATRELTDYCREAGPRFSVGFDLSEPMREAIIAVDERLWAKAIRADGKDRKHSDVREITDHVNLSTWSAGSPRGAQSSKKATGSPSLTTTATAWRCSSPTTHWSLKPSGGYAIGGC
jgi:hypothetical protein